MSCITRINTYEYCFLNELYVGVRWPRPISPDRVKGLKIGSFKTCFWTIYVGYSGKFEYPKFTFNSFLWPNFSKICLSFSKIVLSLPICDPWGPKSRNQFPWGKEQILKRELQDRRKNYFWDIKGKKRKGGLRLII